MEIDPNYGVPVEEISCPGCGKHYGDCEEVCFNCEESARRQGLFLART